MSRTITVNTTFSSLGTFTSVGGPQQDLYGQAIEEEAMFNSVPSYLCQREIWCRGRINPAVIFSDPNNGLIIKVGKYQSYYLATSVLGWFNLKNLPINTTS
jgi:hypothetical protein